MNSANETWEWVNLKEVNFTILIFFCLSFTYNLVLATVLKGVRT